jgi:hypothetical protein
MRMNDVKSPVPHQFPETADRSKIERIAKRKLDIRLYGAARPARNNDLVPKPAQGIGQFNDVGFAAAEIER